MTSERRSERGDKAGYYVVVSRPFIARSEDVYTVICAPVYGYVLGIASEVVIGPEEGVTRLSAVRCDFLTLMFKERLVACAGALGRSKMQELARALAYALDLPLLS